MMRAILFTICVGLIDFLVTMDGFAFSTALPTISGNIGVRPDIASWMVIFYSIMNIFCISLSGFFITRYGKVRVFTLVVCAFVLLSCGAAFAHHFYPLLILRILQGGCAGLLVPITFVLVLPAHPPEKKSFAVALWTFFVITGPIMGVVVGGFFSTHFWHGIFLCNIPLILLALAGAWSLMPKLIETRRPVPVDGVGILFAFVSLVTLLPALNRGQLDDWFRSRFIITLFSTFGIAFTLLIIWEWFQRYPFIHLLIFKRRNFVIAVLLNGLAMFMIFSSISFETSWLQKVLGYPPWTAGLTVGAMGMLPILFYPLVGHFFARVDRRVWVLAGLSTYVLLFFLLSRINLETTFRYLFWIRFTQGLGLALLTVPLALTAFENIHPEDFPFVLALYSLARTFCLSSTSLATALWTHREAFYQVRLASKTAINNPIFISILERIQTIPVTQKQSVAIARNVMVGQAYTLALADIYYLFGWVFLGLCLVTLFIKPQRGPIPLLEIDRTYRFAAQQNTVF